MVPSLQKEKTMEPPPSENNVDTCGTGCKRRRQDDESCNDTLPFSKKMRLDLSERQVSPQEYVSSVFRIKGFPTIVQPAMSVGNVFEEPTEAQIEAYDQEVLCAARNRDIETLRRIHKSGRTLQCCNRFGESLVHLACRRGFTDVFEFLVKEAKVSLCVRDDYGRTPMHDACWAPEPNLVIMEHLLRDVPEQLFLSDVRGHTPFSYVRKHHYAEWVSFLSKKQSLLRPKQQSEEK